MDLKIGISPCPNDTFIFEALAINKVHVPNAQLNFEYHDIKELNAFATEGTLDIVKMSYAHYFNVLEDYIMLPSGGALGHGVGPLLISNNKIEAIKIPNNASIAVPGLNTTANFLLNFALPKHQNKQALLFSEIEQAIIEQQYDLGVIIHENRFTYAEKGLHKVIDLGQYWEEKTQAPIPLGGIAVRRNLGDKTIKVINRAIQEAITWQRTQSNLSHYIKSHAQEMSETVMQQHIDLYVNDESYVLSEQGVKAIELMQQQLKPTNTLQLIASC